jgi:hypothetical protein
MIFGISKTTLAGLLSALMAVTGPLSALFAALQAIKTAPNYNYAIAGAVITCVAAVLRAWVGLLQGDAPPNPTTKP